MLEIYSVILKGHCHSQDCIGRHIKNLAIFHKDQEIVKDCVFFHKLRYKKTGGTPPVFLLLINL